MYSSILMPLDLGQVETSEKALQTAVAMARTFKAELHIVSVVPDFGRSIVGGFFPKDFEKDALTTAGDMLQAFMKENVPGDITSKGHIAHGTIYEEINRAADKLGCDMIVIGSHRPELKDYLLGPNAARVVRHAGQSVLVVRD